MGVPWGAGDSGLNFLSHLSSPQATLSPVAGFQVKETFVGTNAPGTHLQILLVSRSISDHFEDDAFEVHNFFKIVNCVCPPGVILAARIHPLPLSAEGTPRLL